MSTTSDGRKAEAAVADYLKKQGHMIVCMNWRTKWCEIDIVSKKKKIVYFTEVKYRQSDEWGSGFEYVTTKKIQQMQFAAQIWLTDNDWKGDALLQAAEVEADMKITLVEL